MAKNTDVKREFAIIQCPLCRRKKFIACFVEPYGWYVECDHKRGGCGGSSGWYQSLVIKPSIEEDFLIVDADTFEYGHPINQGR